MLKKIVCSLSFLMAATPAYAGFENSPEWLAVVHYQEEDGAYVSTIDSEPFFLSAKGKNNPQAELQATINLFENTEDEEKKCLFPARYKLLQKNGLVSKPFPQCKDLEQFYDEIWLPEELYKVHYKSAITKRNEWLVKNSDLLVAYVVNDSGGAAYSLKQAQKEGVQIKNIVIEEE